MGEKAQKIRLEKRISHNNRRPLDNLPFPCYFLSREKGKRYPSFLARSSPFDELSLRRLASYDAVSFQGKGIPRASFQTLPVSSWFNPPRRYRFSLSPGHD